MADVWRLSDAVSLAMHSMAYLANHRERWATTHEVAGSFHVSEHHLAKVHQRLAHAGLIEAARGPHGGVRLARPPEQITLMQVYETIEGPVHCNPCALGTPKCGRKACILGGLSQRVYQEVSDYLGGTTLAQLIE